MKYDGLSISLTYVDGRLTQAVTRGDGVQGDDVTANVRTIRSIPLVLKDGDWPREFEIRGEILLPWREFERINAEREAAEDFGGKRRLLVQICHWKLRAGLVDRSLRARKN